ncbi:MAG: class I SAM-dependent methyltransferase, partial [Candidatus Omnitrophica bacterium]|nr:class I SAM-dependent methyltransferase [Candidatus Omnitrophota bacterium]
LDVGAGDQPYGDLLPAAVTDYDSIDLTQCHPKQTFVGSATHMNMIADATYDTALCFSVLEHVHDPWKAVAEIRRVLKPGGTLILTVPHLSRLHEIPHDYFRFTHYGLWAMLEDHGFEILESEKNGSFLSFLAHQMSTLLLCLCWRIPGLKQLSWLVNKWLLVLPVAWIDGMFMKTSLMPLNYYCVARVKE